MRKKVLITGVAGLIGSHLAKALLEQGRDVAGVDDFSQGVPANIEPCMKHERFRFHEESILSADRMKEVSEGVAVIFHLAAQKIPRYGGYLRTLHVNVKGTEIMLECARRANARLIFASTDDVYGKGVDSSFTEESPLVLGESRVHRWGAAASKIYGEHLCFGYAEKYGLPIAIVRYSGVYGPTYQLSKLSGAQDLFIAAALSDRPIPIHGDGNQTRPFTYISDAIDATLKVFETPYADGEVINVGSSAQISIVNLAYLVWRLAGLQKKPQLRFIPYTDFSRLYEDPRQRRIDVSKANYLLGYRPRVSLEEGMELQVRWFRNNLEKICALNPEFFQEEENPRT
ncbi:MAG: GDP-mannose 4,6-dehydratase [Acidobacteria bacterium]|nr:GDP-mannose 4,6-dehydratase [Acidobacteriota bacterium]